MLVLGLDGAGKSSVLAALAPARGRDAGAGAAAAPAGAATVRVVLRTPRGAVKVKATDARGERGAAAPAAWPALFAGQEALLWVVDATDALRLQAAQDGLDRAAADARLAGVPLLILVNKADAPGALSAAQVQEALAPECLPGGAREWAVAAGSAATGAGLQEALEWLLAAARRRRAAHA